MLQHIEKLRSKPEHIRRRIAFITSLCFTSLIFAIWIGSFKIQNSPTALDIKSPASSITASVVDSVKYIKESFFGSNKASYQATIEAIPGKR
jgi:hypothetical protein